MLCVSTPSRVLTAALLMHRLQKQVLIQQEAAGVIHPKPPVGWVDKKNRERVPSGPLEPPALLTRTMPADPAQVLGYCTHS